MNEASVQHAVQLFKQHLPDFVDFDHPGTAFEENENRYKRDILASWQEGRREGQGERCYILA